MALLNLWVLCTVSREQRQRNPGTATNTKSSKKEYILLMLYLDDMQYVCTDTDKFIHIPTNTTFGKQFSCPHVLDCALIYPMR